MTIVIPARVTAAREESRTRGPLHVDIVRSIDAPGFLPSVEMTDVGAVHEYRSPSRVPIRHSEPWARNPEAAVLCAASTCSVLSLKLLAWQACSALARAAHELKIRSINAVTREVARATAMSAPDSEMTLK
jgi:hypothetical protein